MSQRYTSQASLARLEFNLCPECGGPPAAHSNDARFWVPRACDLTLDGVRDRIEQYRTDRQAV